MTPVVAPSRTRAAETACRDTPAMPSTSTPGPGHRLFVVVIAGTPDLQPEHYPRIVAALDHFLARRLPQVKSRFRIGTGRHCMPFWSQSRMR